VDWSLSFHICATHRVQIEKRITESIQAQVKIEVGEWGQSAATRRFTDYLKNMVEENEVLHKEAQIKLDNSSVSHLLQWTFPTRRFVANLVTRTRLSMNTPILKRTFQRSDCLMGASVERFRAL